MFVYRRVIKDGGNGYKWSGIWHVRKHFGFHSTFESCRIGEARCSYSWPWRWMGLSGFWMPKQSWKWQRLSWLLKRERLMSQAEKFGDTMNWLKELWGTGGFAKCVELLQTMRWSSWTVFVWSWDEWGKTLTKFRSLCARPICYQEFYAESIYGAQQDVDDLGSFGCWVMKRWCSNDNLRKMQKWGHPSLWMGYCNESITPITCIINGF